MEDLRKIMEEEMRKTFGLPDWSYKDIPWITYELFNELIETIGSNNIRIISGSRMQRKTSDGDFEDCVRCSAMISPEGMERLKNEIAKQKSEES